MCSAEANSGRPDYSAPEFECNLVMKGGITSGIVYPPAVLILATRYRFRQIGGASAGAIAAALTAASEHGRADGGFMRLAEVNDYLSKPANVLALFQPDASTKPLFQVLLAVMRAGAAGAGGKPTALLKRLGGGLTKAAAIAWAYASADPWLVWPVSLLAGGLMLHRGLGWALLVAVLAFAGVALVRLGWILVRVVPRHDFGLCRGLAPGSGGPSALTTWLADELDRVAGIGTGPLTIAQLHARGIDLRMMTTNLSVAEPVSLPFQHRDLLFQVDDMKRLFPPRIVDHLVSKSHRDPRSPAAGLNAKGYYFLPLAGDLPAVFCARLSLSFPMLISAVPLFSVRHVLRNKLPRPGEPFDPDTLLQRHWFSDGGISSNFPVHFFGHWLPQRPTFGIDLAEMPDAAFASADESARAGDAAAGGMRLRAHFTTGDGLQDAVQLPSANRPLHPEWSPITSLADFLGSIWETTHSFRDNMLTQLPGFRERIVRVRFGTGEGGLNLSMSDDAVRRIRAKGQRAGELLRDNFDFEDHRWVHYLVLMAELEEGLNQLAATVRRDPGLLGVFAARTGPPYDRSGTWTAEAVARTQALVALVEQWRATDCGPAPADPLYSNHFRTEEPRPNPELRLGPRV